MGGEVVGGSMLKVSFWIAEWDGASSARDKGFKMRILGDDLMLTSLGSESRFPILH